MPSAFSEALKELCVLLGEGEVAQHESTLNRKDDGLDLVAWSHFPDRYPSKLVMFGQCTAAKDWESKLQDLSIDRFCRFWLSRIVSPGPIKSFFTPHRVLFDKWELAASGSGILFDRCRIAHWAHGRLENKEDVVCQLASRLGGRS